MYVGFLLKTTPNNQTLPLVSVSTSVQSFSIIIVKPFFFSFPAKDNQGLVQGLGERGTPLTGLLNGTSHIGSIEEG